MGSSYRILKLKSGEELITRILSQQKGKLVLERPMIFKTLVMMDGLGRQKEITVLKNWLQFTDQITTDIPKDYIATFLTPDKSSSDLYDLQKEKEDVDPIENKITDADKDSDYTFGTLPEDFLKSLGISGESDEDDEGNLVDLSDPEFIIDSIIHSIIQGMIESGDMERIFNQFKNRKKNDDISDTYTGDETEREDFGNLWSDWDINPNDYLE
ncbi:MAG: hypothetical protein H8D80_00700 [Proteobacteria bacterium]|nr:hypothetical protein [Pseudomonadota bacterium]